jgi:hypothetical protein
VIGSDVKAISVAIDTLCGPDEQSRSKDHEGRRLIREGEFQYFVTGHSKYRAMRDESDRREYNRIKKAESRARSASSAVKTMSNGLSIVSANTEAEAEADAEEIQDRGAAESVGAPRKRSANTTGSRLPAEWILTRELGDWAMQDCGMTRESVKAEAEKFADYWHGVAGAKGRKVDWSATWRNWCRNAKPAQAGAHAAESFRERDQRAAADRVRELTGGLAHDKKRASPLPFESGYSDVIEGEANEQRRIAAR